MRQGETESKASVSPVPIEEKASVSGSEVPTLDVSNLGRIHTDAQMDQLLDHYVLTGETPDYVSDRQQRDYRKHRRLLERVTIAYESGATIHSDVIKRLPKLIEYYDEQGYPIRPNHQRILTTLSGIAQSANVVDFVRTKNQRNHRNRTGA